MPNLRNTLVEMQTAKDSRMSAKEVAYMELAGAKKDADCHKVNVTGGVSTKLGCCNAFQPKDKSVQNFNCGHCEYVKK